MNSFISYTAKKGMQAAYKQIEIVNSEAEGPLIIVSNHSQGFIDGSLILAISDSPVHMLAADVSLKNNLTNALLTPMMRIIPVKRPLDRQFEGEGQISSEGAKILGTNTKFQSQLKDGYSILLPSGSEIRIKRILSDTELELLSPCEFLQNSEFMITPKIQQDEIYEDGVKQLRKGHKIFLCPEGKSHETTGILPFKMGFAFLYLACRASNIPCRIQVLTNIFNHQFNWRGKVMLVFSEAFDFSDDLLTMDRKEAAKIIIRRTEEVVKRDLLILDNYKQISCLFTAERLLRDSAPTPKEKYAKWKEIESQFKSEMKKDATAYVELIDDLHHFKKESNRLGVSKYFNIEEATALGFIRNAFYLILMTVIMSPGFIVLNIHFLCINPFVRKHGEQLMKWQTYRENAQDYKNSMRLIYGFIFCLAVTILLQVIAYWNTGSFLLLFFIYFLFLEYLMLTYRAGDQFQHLSKRLRLFFGKNSSEVRDLEKLREKIKQKLSKIG